MTMMGTVRTGGRGHEIYQFTGEVLAAEGGSVTNVHGAGGGGYDYIEPVRIRSTSTRIDTLFLRDAAGVERSFRLHDLEFGCRPGHIVTVCWAVPRGAKRGPFWYARNHSLDEIQETREFGNAFVLPKAAGLLFVGVAVLAALLLEVTMATGIAIAVGALLLLPLAWYGPMGNATRRSFLRSPLFAKLTRHADEEAAKLSRSRH